MIRLLTGLALVMTVLFSTTTLALSREWRARDTQDDGWQVVTLNSVMNLDGGDVQAFALNEGKILNNVDCSPDGKTLVFVSGNTVHILSADGVERRTIRLDITPAGDVSISNGGEVLMLSGYEDNIYHTYLIHAGNSEWVELHQTLSRYDSGYRVQTDLSSDGRRIAYQTAYQTLIVASADGDLLAQLYGAYLPAWSPDGLLAFAAWWDASSDIYLMDVDRHLIMQVTRQRNAFGNSFPAWSPDGDSIVYGYYRDLYSTFGDLHVLNLHTGDVRRTSAVLDQITCLLTARPTSLVAGS